MKRKRWSSQQNDKLNALYKKYKKQALSNAQVSRKVANELPDRTPTAILTKINRVYHDKTSTVLRKKLGGMTLEQKEKLLIMLTQRQQPSSLPSPPKKVLPSTTTTMIVKKKTPTPPRQPTPLPSTIQKEMQDYLTTGKDSGLKKMVKRLLKLKKPLSPSIKHKKTKPTDKILERAENILGRPLTKPSLFRIPGTQGIQQQLEQEFVSESITPGKKFQREYEKVFKEKPSNVVARVVERAKKRTVRGMEGLEKLLEIYRDLKKKGYNDKEMENMLYMEMRLMLQKHYQEQEKTMKKEQEQLQARHMAERLATLKNIPVEELKRTMKAMEKEEALLEKKELERKKIMQSEFSPATKKALLDVLEMPLAPKTAFAPIKHVRQDSPGDDDNSSDDDDGDVRLTMRKKTKVALR